MTRIGVLTDTHADLAATESILEAARAAGITRLWCLGDFCSGGPQPAATFDCTVDACEHVILGNHETFVLDRAWRRTHAPWAVAAYDAAEELGPARLRRLRALPAHVTARDAELAHGSLTDRAFCHAFLDDAHVARANLGLLRRPLLCFGHTHRAARWQRAGGGGAVEAPALLDQPTPLADGALVNPGAGCDAAGARWLELEIDAGAIVATWRRTGVAGHGGVVSETP